MNVSLLPQFAPKKTMGRRFLFCLLLGILSASCEKSVNPQEHPVTPDNDSLETIPVNALIISFDGIVQKVPLCTGVQDTLMVQEEGLRRFQIIGYEPKNAAPPVIDSINFYRDLYSFNYSGDSIHIVDGKYSGPKNHYLLFSGSSFDDLTGAEADISTPVNFYNYVNRSYDKCSVEKEDGPHTIWWRDYGKLRLYRIEIVLKKQGKNRFSIPFYERENEVVLPDTISVCPGDSVQLGHNVSAPPEFTVYEWSKGWAGKYIYPLNASSVEKVFMDGISNPLLTEEGKRYTSSKINLSRTGLLTVDKDWGPSKAESAGGAIYNSIPISIIYMPQGNPIVGKMKRTFLFPDGRTLEQHPTPFYCNAVVKIRAL